MVPNLLLNCVLTLFSESQKDEEGLKSNKLLLPQPGMLPNLRKALKQASLPYGLGVYIERNSKDLELDTNFFLLSANNRFLMIKYQSSFRVVK